jgi:response regulator RpfG family c-di-GMP phosphodiesterase
MICENEPDLLLTYTAMLSSEYSVITTSSGMQCLETYVQKKNDGQTIDIILLDYKLGDMNGDLVAKAIIALNGTTRIILISAYEIDPETIRELFRNKIIVGFLSKPFSPTLLKEGIKRSIFDSRTTI